MPNAQVRSTDRVKTMWTNKGSWLLLAGIAISMFLAGATMQAYVYTGALKVVQESFDKKEAEYKQRIRDLNDELKALIPRVELAADKAVQAVESAKPKTEEVMNNEQDNR